MFANEYIEKIVQKSIPLPAIEQRDIDNFLDVHIEKLFKEIDIDQEKRAKFDKDFSYIYQTKIRKLFKTLRHAKRYINGLRSTLPPIKSEVNLYDFFILETLRMFCLKVYSDIWKNPWFYIPLNWSDSTYLLSPFSYASRSQAEYKKQIKDHIESVIREEKESQLIKELLETIFFVTVKDAFGTATTDHSHAAPTYRTEQRITHPKCFRKYFMLKVPPTEISDDFIETTLRAWSKIKKPNREETIKRAFWELQRNDNLLGFIKELMVFVDKISKPVALDIIRTIYKNVENFSKKGTENFWNSEYDKAESLLMWLINDKISRVRIQNVIEEIITQTKYLPFAVRVILSCKKERGGSFFNIYETIDVENMQHIVSSRLKQYFIEENRDIFEIFLDEKEWTFVLYQWATNWGNPTDNNKKIVTDYLKSIVSNASQKLVTFLQKFIITAHSDVPFFDLKEFSKAYETEVFIKIASNFKNDPRISTEELKILNMFLKVATSKKQKVLYYEPLSANLDQNMIEKGWKIARKKEELKEIKNYDVVILFLHEEAGKGMHEGLSSETQEDIIKYVGDGGNLIAFHDVLFSRNKILSNNLCGNFKSPLGGKKDDVYLKIKERHAINQNISNFKIKDEGWEGAIPKVEPGEKLTILFVNQNEEPVAWLRQYRNGEVLVISLGHSKELIKDENIQAMLNNAIRYFMSKK